jgi:pyridoxamine 5'-phosphate oxidase
MLEKNPIDIFKNWFAEAKNHEAIKDHTAMSLATATKDAIPSLRTVLLKDVSEQGFVFYTNLRSKKGKELSENPNAALCFYWAALDKQVRIEGRVEKVSDKEADEYFASREKDSDISAWASKQSQILRDPQEFLTRIKKYEEEFSGENVPRPDFWSGYRVVPNLIEFWENLDHRRHERHLFEKINGGWKACLLYP